MPGNPVRLLVVHGGILVFLGLLAGFPFWFAIIRDRGANRIQAWRVAHTTVLGDGLLLLVVALVSHQAAVSGALMAVAAWALVVSAYGFVFALIVGAWAGERGLNPIPWGLNSLFFVGHAVGATGALVGMGLVLYGLLR
jgi:uncharacterized membrane protein